MRVGTLGIWQDERAQRARLPSSSKTAQRGQALPVGIAAILFSVALTLALFNTAQMTTEKERLANTADAAAYSGLVWEARALNFQAYMNRMAVANQVAVAQTVSIVSWIQYAEKTLENLSYIPVVNIVTGPLKQAVAAINQAIQGVSAVVVPVIDGFLTAFSVAQIAVHNSVAATVPDVVREVVKANDDRFEVTPYGYAKLADHAGEWYSFTDQKKNLPGLTRMQAVILDSRDRFSGVRNWSEKFPGVPPVGLDHGNWVWAGVYKDGGTRLVKYGDEDDPQWEWKANDGISLAHRKSRSSKRIKCPAYWEEVTPVGWGAGYASSSKSDFAGRFGGTPQPCIKPAYIQPAIPQAMRLSEDEISDVSADLIYGGVRKYYDVKDASRTNTDPRLSLVVEVALPGKKIKTSTKAGFGSPGAPVPSRNGIAEGLFALPDKFAQVPAIGEPELSAVAKAEVFFKRPVARADGRDEYGNLFNPYWDVRLVDAGAERKAIWTLKGLGGFFNGGVAPK